MLYIDWNQAICTLFPLLGLLLFIEYANNLRRGICPYDLKPFINYLCSTKKYRHLLNICNSLECVE